MARLDELWRSVDGPGSPPHLDSRRVKARVNAALDADQAERKMYMKQKLRAALIAAAAIAALTGSAFAATTGWTGLSAWFKGDPAPVQEYVDNTVRSVSDENYSFTVEGSAADDSSVYLTATITALSGEAKEFLYDECFVSMDTLDVWIPSQDPDAPSDSLRPVGFGSRELQSTQENSRRFALAVDSLPYPVDTLYVRCGYMEKGKWVKVPVSAPAPSVTVHIGASGAGALDLTYTEGTDDNMLTIDEITLSAFTCHISGHGSLNVRPNIRLRMADGAVLTQSQLMDDTSSHYDAGSGQSDHFYRFKEVQNLDSILSVIVFDMEYPVDGSKPIPVEHDPALDPFTVTRMEPLDKERGGYTLPVRELTEKLGGTCTWDPATGGVTCVYRDVTIVLHAGKDAALVNGETVDLLAAPAEQNGALAADWQVFEESWGIGGFVQWEHIRNKKDPKDMEIIWHDWYIIP